jgi:hypothetical protein|nr:MAG TPA: Protein of unknown function (DUF3789) [Caudoviricetes sp.]
MPGDKEKWFYIGLFIGAVVGIFIWSFLKVTGKVY